MTLVVARKTDEILQIESDSKINDRNTVRNGPFLGVLKTLIITPNLSISYAGRIRPAEIALEEVFKLSTWNSRQLYQHLLQANIESDNETDFLVCFTHGLKSSITKIADGMISEDQQYAWIGDHEAYQFFNEKRLRLIADGSDHIDAQTQAFRAVIETPELHTVDGYHVSVGTQCVTENDKGVLKDVRILQYLLRTELKLNRDVPQENSNSEYMTVKFGAAAEGTHALSSLVSNSPNQPAIAMHYPHGNMGIAYFPKKGVHGLTIEGVTPTQFVQYLNTEFKIPLRGILICDSTASFTTLNQTISDIA